MLSGDTVCLVGKAVNGPPPEITITFASIQSPRPARGPQQSDEPFAWQAREYLRKLCIGKQVSFRIVQNVPAINRTFGDVELDGEILALAVVRSGWATVKESREQYNSACYQSLVELEATAKESKIGIFSDFKEGNVRNICWNPTPAFAEDLLAKFKGKSIRVVIEYIRDGATFRCLHLDSMTYVNASLTGVLCPRMNTSPNTANANKGESGDVTASSGPTPEPEPFALQAKHFTELRLLNREVDLVLDGVDRSGGLMVTVLHPKGNISVEIVRAGLGRVADWSLVFLSR